ncbi:MAG: hypothetical protein II214_01055 [Alistipes sp.]|nr:hypothetical protein [Alistipes sp.]
MKRVLTLLLLLLSGVAMAQTEIERPNLGVPSKIAPAYFGPNAFPVPDMLDGRTSSKLKLELYGDCFLGTTTSNVADDITGDIFAKLTIPLFTPKANLTVWMPIFEYYYTSAEVNALRRLPHTGDLQGLDSGDVYVSADVRILSQERHYIDMAARAVLKTASANKFAEGRCYDAPGYFFDVALGHSFNLVGGNHYLRLVASGGFLCWQTDNGRQNDAVMYGAMLAYRLKRFSIDATLGGYIGWERDGDSPMTLKTNLSYHIDNLTLRLGYQVGLNDWPYHQIRIGATYAFNILSK